MAETREATKSKTEMAKGPGKSMEIERRPSRSSMGNGNAPAFMRRFVDEMDQLFEDFGLRLPSFLNSGRELLKSELGAMPMEWSPRIDVLERNGQFLVSADLPGMSRDDIKVDIRDDMMVIQGERRQEQSREEPGYSYSECSYGSFYRSIPLPEGADASKASAEFRNGVLEVAMPAPKRPEAQARRLEIHEKK